MYLLNGPALIGSEYLIRSHSREEGFVPAHSLAVQSIPTGMHGGLSRGFGMVRLLAPI